MKALLTQALSTKALLMTLASGMMLLFVSPARADPLLIVPGRSIGRTPLGSHGDFYLRRLPHPDGTDAAMGGKRRLVWKSQAGQDTLTIFAVSREFYEPPRPGLIIREIRVTSRQFHTHDGTRPGATLAQIQKRFPHGVISGTNGHFYQVRRQGIAFEFARNPAPAEHCIAVTVYPPGPTALLITDAQVQSILHSGNHT